jgi:hypothetical protein
VQCVGLARSEYATAGTRLEEQRRTGVRDYENFLILHWLSSIIVWVLAHALGGAQFPVRCGAEIGCAVSCEVVDRRGEINRPSGIGWAG